MENGASIYNENYDEISLMEIINILLKRKWLIVLCLSFTLLLTIVYLLIKKPIYESRAVVMIGRIYQIARAEQTGSSEKPTPLEDPVTIVRQLKEEYRVNDDSEGMRKLPLLYEVSSDQKTAENIITLSARGLSSRQAREFLSEVTGKLLRQHEQLYNQAIRLQQGRLNSLKDQLKQLNAEMVRYDQKIQKSSDSALAAILTLEKAKLIEQRPVLEEQISELELIISPVYAKPTRLLREPTLPVKPVQPKKKLYLALATVLGMMLGTFAAFFAEFIDKLKRY